MISTETFDDHGLGLLDHANTLDEDHENEDNKDDKDDWHGASEL